MRKKPDPTRIVLPSLGQPTFLAPGEAVLSVAVALAAETDLVVEFCEGFSLREVGHQRESLPLKPLGSSPVTREEIGLSRVSKGDRQFFRIQLELPADATGQMAERRFRLFDLRHASARSSPHSVVVLAHNCEELSVLFAADLHVADRWERLEEQLRSLKTEREPYSTEVLTDPGRFFTRECFRECFVNPNRNLSALISTANVLARRRQLDAIIFGGDLVDYVHRLFKGVETEIYEHTNFYLLEQLVLGRNHCGEELEVPILTSTGNHDYRLYPYKINTYGLQHCGLHHFQTRFLNNTKEKPRLGVPTRRDLHSISARTGQHHSLKYYFDFINPSLNYKINLGGLSVMILDTGRDAWLGLLKIHPRRWINILRGIRHGLDDPTSEGVRQEQVALLRRWVDDSDDDADVLLVFHAGIFNPAPRESANTYQCGSPPEWPTSKAPETPERFDFSAYVSMPETLAGRLAFEKDLDRRSLNVGCIIQNQLPILKAAQRRRFLGLSGHIHRRVHGRMKRNGAVLEICGKSDRKIDLDDDSLFCSAAALGHVQTKYDVPFRPGYYLIRCKGGQISGLEWNEQRGYPFDRMEFWLHMRRTGRSQAVLHSQIDVHSEVLKSSIEELRLILTLIVLEQGQEADPSIVIEIDERAIVDLEQRRVLSPAIVSRFFDAGKRATVHAYVSRVRREICFQVASKREFQRTDELLGIAEIVREKDGAWETLCSSWHPRSLHLTGSVA